MVRTHLVNALWAMLLLPTSSLVLAAGPGSCHPYPGAVAQDCLSLISRNLNNIDTMPCSKGRATLTQDNCSIVVLCASGQTEVEIDITVRRVLTTIGSCALNDYGSISGYFVADDGTKTCYLYPSRENHCR